MMTVQAMYDLTHTRARTLLESVTYPWEALDGIGEAIMQLGPRWTRKHTIILRKMFGLRKAPR